MVRICLISFLMVFSTMVEAEILYQDPTGKTLNQAFKKYSEEEIKDISGSREKEYLLGLLYLSGDNGFDVRQSCAKAKALLSSAWHKNVVDAGYSLGVMSYNGDCVKKDVDRSRKLIEKTAEEGFVLSQRMLGRAFWDEEWKNLVPKDMDKAIYWLGKAGDGGDTQSAGNLAYIYKVGDGVPVDDVKSFCWARKSAFSKYEPDGGVGFTSLAEYYENGIGTQVDLVKAYMYYDLYGSMGVRDKQRLAKKMTQKQIDEAIRQSQEWQKEHNVKVGGGFIRRAN
ncbi:hypothetical protein GY26_19290 [Gammaproteobacteria bacterium MFB021]|nr:hypothetical protein GY26_19290 [Gammaproteobacteria bacterium MFB021]